MQSLPFVAGGSSNKCRKTMTAALNKLLSLPSRTGEVVVSKTEIEHMLELDNAIGESASLAITFNGNANPKDLSFFPALTTVYKDPEVKCCGSPVYRDFSKTVWLHKETSGLWRVGAALNGGTTYLTSVMTGGLLPPPVGFCNGGGDELVREELFILDATLWSGMVSYYIMQEPRGLPSRPDESSAPAPAVRLPVSSKAPAKAVNIISPWRTRVTSAVLLHSEVSIAAKANPSGIIRAATTVPAGIFRAGSTNLATQPRSAVALTLYTFQNVLNCASEMQQVRVHVTCTTHPAKKV